MKKHADFPSMRANDMNISNNRYRYSIAIFFIAIVFIFSLPAQARGYGYDYDHKNYYKYKYRNHYSYGHKYRYNRHYYPVGYLAHSLPRGYVSFSFGGHPYFFHAGTYYRPYNSYYRVVRSPYYYGRTHRHYSDYDEEEEEYDSTKSSSRVKEGYAYPLRGQDANRVQRDKYECYLWASEQTGYDPANIRKVNYSGKETDYQRARSACLEARGYSVK